MIFWLLVACGGTPAPLGDPCGVAAAEHAALADGLGAMLRDDLRALDPDAFRAWCESVHAPARPCLAPSYAVAHPECESLLASAPRPPSLDAPRSTD